MTEVRINCDDAAFECREQLDSAIAHVAASSADIRHASGLTAATKAYACADLVLHHLDARHELEIQRFTDLRREARKLIERYWETFKLLAIVRANGSVVHAQPVEAKPRPANGGAPLVRGKKHWRQKLTNEQVEEIKDYVRKLGRPAEGSDDQYLAKYYNVSQSLIYKIRKGFQRAEAR